MSKFRDWCRLPFWGELSAANQPGPIIGLVVFVVGLAVVEAVFMPFGLTPLEATGWAASCLIGLLLTGVAAFRLGGRTQLTDLEGVVTLVSMFALEFACLFAIARSEYAGVGVFGPLALATVGSHGWQMKAALENAFVLMVSAAAVLLAAACSETTQNLALVLAIGSASIIVEYIFGGIGLESFRSQQRQIRVGNMLEVQRIADRVLSVDRLEELMAEHREKLHDIANVMTSIRFNAGALQSDFGAKVSGLSETVEDLLMGIESVDREVETARVTLKNRGETDLAGEWVTMETVAQGVARLVKSRREDVELTVEGPAMEVYAVGGGIILERLLQNVMFNACEGNGKVAASKINVVWSFGKDDLATLKISDNGPGFPEVLLGELETAYTTKASGSGLGLWIVDRIVRGLGGRWVRKNDPGGGAVVEVTGLRGRAP